MDATDSNLMTLGDVARQFPGVPLHRIKYVIDSHRIAPRRRAGILRMWHPDDVAVIREALQRIALRREGDSHAL